jgi:hypothetical protein
MRRGAKFAVEQAWKTTSRNREFIMMRLRRGETVPALFPHRLAGFLPVC